MQLKSVFSPSPLLSSALTFLILTVLIFPYSNLTVPSVYSETYYWIDDNGTKHFTEELNLERENYTLDGKRVGGPKPDPVTAPSPQRPVTQALKQVKRLSTETETLTDTPRKFSMVFIEIDTRGADGIYGDILKCDLAAMNQKLKKKPKLLYAKNPTGWTPLTMAIGKGCFNTVKYLVDKGVDLNEKHHKLGFTPLHLAIYTKQNDVAEILIKKGADVNLFCSPDNSRVYWYSNMEYSPMHFAIQCRNYEVLDKMLFAGGNPNIKTDDGRSLFRYAVDSNERDEITKTFKRHGIPIPEQAHTVDELIEAISESYATDSRKKGLASYQKILENNPGLAKKADATGYSPLHMAVFYHMEEQVKQLLSLGAPVNVKTSYGDTPMHKHLHDISIARMLLNQGADINAVNNDGETPLHLIAEYNDNQKSLEIVQLYLQYGASKTMKDKSGRTPYDVAVAKKYNPTFTNALNPAIKTKTSPIPVLKPIAIQSSISFPKSGNERPESGKQDKPVKEPDRIWKYHAGTAPTAHTFVYELNDHVTVYDVSTGKTVWESNPSEKIERLCVSENGKVLVTTSDSTILQVRDMETGALINTLNTTIEKKSLSDLQTDPMGRCTIASYGGGYIYSTEKDQITVILDNATGKLLRTVRGTRVYAVDPKGRYIAMRKGLKSTNVERSGNMIYTKKNDLPKGQGIDGLFGDDTSQEILLYSLSDGKRMNVLRGHKDTIRRIIIDAGGDRVFGASDSGLATLWDVKTAKVIRSFTIEGEKIDPNRLLKIDATGRYILYKGANASTFSVWDLSTGKQTLSAKEDKNISRIESYGPYVIAYSSAKLTSWDMSNGKRLAHLQTPYCTEIAIDPGGRFGAFSAQKNAYVFDLTTGDAVKPLMGHSNTIRHIQFINNPAISPHPVLVSRCDSGIINAWDAATGDLIRTETMVPKLSSYIPLTRVIGNRYVVNQDPQNNPAAWDLKDNVCRSLVNDGNPAAEDRDLSADSSMDTLISCLGSPSGKTRLSAFNRIKAIGKDGDGKRLAEIYHKEQNPGLRAWMAGAIADIAGNQTLDYVSGLIKQNNPVVQLFCLQIFTRTGSDKGVALALPLLTKGKKKENGQATRHYLDTVYKDNPEKLYSLLLEHGNSSMKQEAMTYFEKAGGDSSVDLLAAELDSKSSDKALNDVCERIGRVSGDKAFSVLEKARSNPSTLVRAASLNGFSVITTNRNQARDLILDSLKNETQSMVRTAAAKALAEFKDDTAFQALTAVLNKSDETSFVLKAAVESLGKLQNPRAVEPLTAFLDGDLEKKAYVVKALGSIHHDKAVETLTGLLKDRELKYWQLKLFTEALENIGGDLVISRMKQLVKEGDANQRAVAVEILGNSNDAKVSGLIIEALSDQDTTVRWFAWSALGKIGSCDASVFARLIPFLNKEETATCAMLAMKIAKKKGIIFDYSGSRKPLPLSIADRNERQAAAKTLEALADPGALCPLLFDRYTLGTPEPETKKDIRNLLVRMKYEPIMSDLIKDIHSSDRQTRRYAALNVISFGGDKAFNVINNVLDGGDINAKIAMTGVLDEYKDDRATNLLMKALKDSHAEVRQSAIQCGWSHPNILIDILNSQNKNARMEVIQFLKSKQRHPNWVQKMMDIEANDADPDVRKKAAELLFVWGIQR